MACLPLNASVSELHSKSSVRGGAYPGIDDKGNLCNKLADDAQTKMSRSLDGLGPVQPIADAIIVAVQAGSATIRIERTSDAVSVGDLVALHR